MDKKQSFSDWKIWTANPSLYNSEKPVSTWLGVGNKCFVPEEPINQIANNKTTQETNIMVRCILVVFSKGIKYFNIKIMVKKSYLN